MTGQLLRRKAPLMAAVALTLAAAGSAFGQSRPNQPPPNLLDDGRNAPPRDVRGGDRDRGGDRGDRMRPSDVAVGGPAGPIWMGHDQQFDFPHAEVHDAVDANARATFARAQMHRLEYALDGAIRQMQYGFDHSRELTDARKAEDQAWHDYVAARNGALKSVVNDPKYQANVTLKNELGEQIADSRATWDAARPSGKGVSTADYDKQAMKSVVGLAEVKLSYAQVVTDMEVKALRDDSKVADARHKLMDAGARVQSLRDDFDMKLRTSPELASLRRQIEEAHVAYVAAESYRDGSVEAANVALDYAYWKNRYNFPNYSSDYWGYGYGYGTRVVRY